MPTEYPPTVNYPGRRGSASGHYLRFKRIRIIVREYTRQDLLTAINPERTDTHNLHANRCSHLCKPRKIGKPKPARNF